MATIQLYDKRELAAAYLFYNIGSLVKAEVSYSNSIVIMLAVCLDLNFIESKMYFLTMIFTSMLEEYIYLNKKLDEKLCFWFFKVTYGLHF